jgi:hypothetical protein
MRENTNQVVEMRRLIQAMRIDLFGARVSIALATAILLLGLPAAFLGMYYWINLQRAYTPSYEFHSAFWIVLLTFTVSAATNAFSSLHDKAQRISFLMSPGSVVEKFISRFLLSSVGVVAAVTLVYYGQSVVLMELGRLVGLQFPLFKPFCHETYVALHLAIVVQSVFFFGSVSFHKVKLSALATLFLLIVLGVVCVAVVFLVLRLAGGSEFAQLIVALSTNQPFAAEYLHASAISQVWQGGAVFLKWILAPILWIIAFVRFTEVEC